MISKGTKLIWNEETATLLCKDFVFKEGTQCNGIIRALINKRFELTFGFTTPFRMRVLSSDYFCPLVWKMIQNPQENQELIEQWRVYSAQDDKLISLGVIIN